MPSLKISTGKIIWIEWDFNPIVPTVLPLYSSALSWTYAMDSSDSTLPVISPLQLLPWLLKCKKNKPAMQETCVWSLG